LWMTFKIALRALGRNKLRSALTMLGIIIGVGAVIAMVSIGQGAQASVQEQIANVGTNLLYVSAGSANSGGMRMGSGSTTTLTPDDIDAIERECPTVKMATPAVRASVTVVFGNQNWSTGAQGVDPDFPAIRRWPVQTGEFFTDADIRTA